MWEESSCILLLPLWEAISSRKYFNRFDSYFNLPKFYYNLLTYPSSYYFLTIYPFGLCFLTVSLIYSLLELALSGLSKETDFMCLEALTGKLN